MFGLGKSENLRSFEKIVKGMGEDEIPSIALSVYSCWKLFNVKYTSVEEWRNNEENIVGWLTFLDTLAKDQLKKEMNEDLPFGTTSGVYLTLFFFKAVALNEGAKTINAMSDYMERFNQLGFKLSQEDGNP